MAHAGDPAVEPPEGPVDPRRGGEAVEEGGGSLRPGALPNPGVGPTGEWRGRIGADAFDVAIPGIEHVGTVFGANSYETHEVTDAYLAELRDPPYRSLASILLSGRVNPWRAAGMADLLGKTTRDLGYLEYLLARDHVREDVIATMAEHDLDAFVYATFDHPPAPIADDVETNSAPDDRYALGDNRSLSPLTGFPALTVPAGFTDDGLPVGLEFLGRPFTEAMLLGFGYAYEQATNPRRPPSTAPPLGG